MECKGILSDPNQLYFASMRSTPGCLIDRLHHKLSTGMPVTTPNKSTRAVAVVLRARMTGQYLLDILRLFPHRLLRLWRHLPALWRYQRHRYCHGLQLTAISKVGFWLAELVLLLGDLIGLPDIYQILSVWLKPASRPLLAAETEAARSLFGDQLPYSRIWVDETARLGPRQYHFCYVSFNLINSWGGMPLPVLIHELVHVWQYNRYGSPYLLRALGAQYSAEGYHYGGVTGLQQAREEAAGLEYFNYEQQAAIVEDYVRLSKGLPLRWAGATAEQLGLYASFVRSLSDRAVGAQPSHRN